jgi:hypothetical protein
VSGVREEEETVIDEKDTLDPRKLIRSADTPSAADEEADATAEARRGGQELLRARQDVLT